MRAWVWFVLIAGVVGACVFLVQRYPDDEIDRMNAAISVHRGPVDLSARQLLRLASGLNESGLGTEKVTREVVVLLVCSGHGQRATLESSARRALQRIASQGATPKQAIRDQMLMFDPSASESFTECPV